MDEARFPPGFAASLVGAVAGLVGGAVLTAVVAWPLALVSWTAVAVGPAPDGGSARRLLVAFVLLLALQLMASAWIAQQAASLVSDGRVLYRRAFAAVGLGALATLGAAAILPDDAGLPVLGYSWVGNLATAWVLSSGPVARPAA